MGACARVVFGENFGPDENGSGISPFRLFPFLGLGIL
jgi:hypothetical protein